MAEATQLDPGLDRAADVTPSSQPSKYQIRDVSLNIHSRHFGWINIMRCRMRTSQCSYESPLLHWLSACHIIPTYYAVGNFAGTASLQKTLSARMSFSKLHASTLRSATQEAPCCECWNELPPTRLRTRTCTRSSSSCCANSQIFGRCLEVTGATHQPAQDQWPNSSRSAMNREFMHAQWPHCATPIPGIREIKMRSLSSVSKM